MNKLESAIFRVGSLTVTPKREEDSEGIRFDALRVELEGPPRTVRGLKKARLYTTIDKYEAMQLRDAITRWLEAP